MELFGHGVSKKRASYLSTRIQLGTSEHASSGKSSLLAGTALLLLAVSAAGCTKIINHYSRPLFDDIAKSFMQQRDIVLAEQGVPAFLLILDGMIVRNPDDKSLFLSGAKAYASYAAAFVGDKNPERNRILTEKAKEYAFRAFSLHNRTFSGAKERPGLEFADYLSGLGNRDVPFLYYAATCWAGWIQANSESWDAIADLPKVESLVKRVIELDEGFSFGASHAFMGILLTIRPPSLGGKPDEARQHFERALELGRGRYLPSYVMYAKHYAKPAYEKKLFFNLLERVMHAPVDEVPELVLINTLAQQQAADLIDGARKENYFD